MNDSTDQLKNFKRIVIKIGSALLVDRETGLRTTWLEAMADDIQSLVAIGKEIIVVSSGAISLGRIVLKNRKDNPLDGIASGVLKLEESQAAAAIGQIELSRAYSEVLSRRGISSGQVLLTPGDTQARRRYLNARSTISTLLKWNSVPVINENDTVATAEIRYGDNDRLAARVATMMGCDLLILLSDVEGLCKQVPPENADASFLSANLIERVEKIDSTIEAMAGESKSDHSRGGMKTKIEAAKIATAAGTTLVITNGRKYHPLTELQRGAVATWFAKSPNPVTDRKKWIAGQLETKGRVTVDAGALKALRNGKSLLSAGVVLVEGEFERGDTVSVLDTTKNEVGRGLASYDSVDAKRIAGLKSEQITDLLGVASRSELIHRDDLVLKDYR